MLPHLRSYLSIHNLSTAEFPLCVHAPGRINIIGEHTDYTDGLVMPASIDKGLEFYARPNNERFLRLHAVDLGETYDLPLPVTAKTGNLWVDYLAGISNEFQLLGNSLVGLEIVFGGDLPRGSGMSSSAALEGGMAFLLNEFLNTGLSRPELAKLCKRSSNNFIGIPSGIMDQFASLNGTAAGPIMLDCGSLEFSPINANLDGYQWLLVNSMVSHELTGSEYPDRVRQCAEALALIREEFPDTPNLSAVSPTQLSAVTDTMPETVRMRARHVVSENERVRKMADALASGNAHDAGELMNATHASLRDDFEVSCPEVDFLQHEVTEKFPDIVVGSRIMGGGFGGCTINLVKTAGLPVLRQHLLEAYFAAYGRRPEFYAVNISDGVRRF